MNTELAEREEVEQELAQVEPAKPLNVFEGISAEAVSDEQRDILVGDLDPTDVEIRPDGIVYMPQIKYRRVLNETFKPGGWALMPHGKPNVISSVMMREFGLYVNGRFFASAIGEQEYFEDNPTMSYATAHEAAKSDAMVRCCKDLGIASCLWDESFRLEWKAKYATSAWYENEKTQKKKKLWWRKDRNREDAIRWPWKLSDRNAPVETTARGLSTLRKVGAPPKDDFQREPEPKGDMKASSHMDVISEKQQSRLFAIARSAGWVIPDVGRDKEWGNIKVWLKKEWSYDSTGDITRGTVYENIIAAIQKGPPKEEPAVVVPDVPEDTGYTQDSDLPF